MGSKYYVAASSYPFDGYWEDCKYCETLDEAVNAIKDFQNLGMWIINLECRDNGGHE